MRRCLPSLHYLHLPGEPSSLEPGRVNLETKMRWISIDVDAGEQLNPYHYTFHRRKPMNASFSNDEVPEVRLLTAEDVARRLAVSRRYAYHLMETG